jgi:hypothetical protein
MATAKKSLSRIQRLVSLRITGAIHTICMGGMEETLTCLPPLDLVVQGEARSATHQLWSLWCWPYLRHNSGHNRILMQLQGSDPMLNMGVKAMRSAFHFEPKYRVTTLTKEEWTRGPGTPPLVKGLIWYTDGSRTWGETWAGVYGQSSGRRHSISLGKYTTVFQAKICAILACAHKIKMNSRLGK